MGEKQKQPFHLPFNAFLRFDLQGSRVTSDRALILMHELDEHPGFSKLTQPHLKDSRERTPSRLSLTCCGSGR